MTSDNEFPDREGWIRGWAIEAGVDQEDAKKYFEDAIKALREMFSPLGGAAIGGAVGGGAAATATGLGGVGLAFGGSAIGIGALAAVAAPAAVGATAVGGVGYAVAKIIRQAKGRSRTQNLREIDEGFQKTGQFDKRVRLYEIEGKGSLLEDRNPPTTNSVSVLRIVLGSSESAAHVGLFCSPQGDFVLTYDLEDGRYACIKLLADDRFEGVGIDTRGQNFTVEKYSSVDLLNDKLEREGFVSYPDPEE